MISRSSAVPHICLSCRRSLASTTSAFGTTLAKQYSTQSPQDSIREDATERDGPSTSSSDAAPRFRIDRRPRNTLRYPSIKRYGGVQSRDRVDGTKLHGHRGRKLQQNVEDLGINSLGGSAKAVILQDSKYTYYTNERRLADLKSEHLDLGKLLDAERGIVTADQVYRSIEELRPGIGHDKVVVSWEEFNKIVKALSDGFSTAQVQTYIHRFKQENGQLIGQRSATQNEEEKPADQSILEVRPWRPGLTPSIDSFDFDPLQGYAVSSYTSKQKIVLHIVRECWGVEAVELVEGIGQFEVVFQEQDLKLLTTISETSLRQIQQEYLTSEQEGLKIFAARNTVRITTWKHKMQVLLQLLEDDVAFIESDTVDLKPLLSSKKRPKGARDDRRRLQSCLSDEVLMEVGKITNTVIARLSDYQLVVTGFNDEEQPHLSNSVDTAKRLLVRFVHEAGTSDYRKQHGHPLLESSHPEYGTLSKYPCIEGLSWWQQLRSWSRWTSPVIKSHSDPGNTTSIDNKSAIPPLPQQALQHTTSKAYDTYTSTWNSENNSSTRLATPHWGRHRHTISATFGVILQSPLVDSLPPRSPWEQNSLSTFSTTVPNLSRFLQKTSLLTELEWTARSNVNKSIVLNFIPYPRSRSDDDQNMNGSIDAGIDTSYLPSVDMTLIVREDGTISHHRTEVPIVDARSDVLLSNNTVDIRYNHTVRRTAKDVETVKAPLLDFVHKSIIDIKRGVMKTPPAITLPIDRNMLSEEAQTALKFTTETRDINYLFAGLEIRSTVRLSWKGWGLLYTSIDAGRAGGCRTELKIVPIRVGGGEGKSRAEFMNAAIEIAHEIGENPSLVEAALASQAEIAKQNQSLDMVEVEKRGQRKFQSREGGNRAPEGVQKREEVVRRVVEDWNAMIQEEEAVWNDWDADEASGLDAEFGVEDMLDEDVEADGDK